ncbi:MAG: beta-propeller domain-containing protein, partial [Archangium sp.]
MRASASFIVALLITACTAPNAPADDAEDFFEESEFPETPPGAVDRVALTNFEGCAQLEASIETLAIQQFRLALSQSRKSALQSWEWHRSNRNNGWSTSDAGSAVGGAAGGGTGSASSGPTDFTTTNTQHEDIDEPDIIKNDGTRMFTVSGRKLFATTTWPANQLRTRGSVQLEGQPFELLLVGDRVLAFSRVFEPSFGVPRYCSGGTCGSWYSNATAITWVDVSNLDALRVIETRRVPGAYQTARRVDDVVRLVSTSNMNLYELVDTWVDWSFITSATSKQQIDNRFAALRRQGEATLRSRSLAQWLPGIAYDATSCAEVWRTNASTQVGATHITSLSVSDPSALTRQTLLAPVD